MERKPVIILGVEPRITVPVARSLHRIGVPVALASLSPRDPALHSTAIFRFFRLPDYEHSPDFVPALAAFAREHGCDTLIPATDGALSAISRHYAELSPLLHLACPPARIIDRVLNKEETLAIASGCGIRVPREYIVSSRAIADAAELTFPVVAKPRHKSSAESFKVRYFHSANELSVALQSGQLDDVILQEYCLGQGVGVEVLFYQGVCIASFQHRRVKEFPHTGGAAAVAVAETVDPTLKDMALTLLRGLEWEGIAMVEFRHDAKSGNAVLMEVNGRYFGTIALPIMAGVDFPAFEWQIRHGETPEVPSSYPAGLRWRWSAGMFKRWHGILTSSKSTLPTAGQEQGAQSQVDRGSAPRDALWSVQDPLPAILELTRAVRTLAVQDAKAVVKRLLPRSALSLLRVRSKPH